ncbi:MAG: hypothetical protein JO166_21840 [Deltaproteobacteria bacterium]|nr:hypothetical protein [Deltaproteobacteria bacterium]
MVGNGISQVTDIVGGSVPMPEGDLQLIGRSTWFLGLTLLALAVGLVSLLTYSLAASELVRSDAPALAAWWEAHQFLLMEGGATALGLLLGIAIGESFLPRHDQRFRASLVALLFAIVAFAPLIHMCSVAARLGWSARAAAVTSWLIGRGGYEVGRQIDKVAIAGVYFFKTIGFALLAGLGLLAIACVAVIAFESANTETN